MTAPNEFPQAFPGFDPETMLISPDLCARHREDLVIWKLHIMPDGPWMAAELLAKLFLVLVAVADDAIYADVAIEMAKLGEPRTSAKSIRAMNVALGRAGCLACRLPAYYDAMCRVMQKGLEHAARVSRREVDDPDWPFFGRKETVNRVAGAIDRGEAAGSPSEHPGAGRPESPDA